MPASQVRIPDGPLAPMQTGHLPPDVRRRFLREAGRACALYLREGGRLGDIRPEDSRFQEGRLQLHPLPKGARTSYPDRSRLESDLRDLERGWASAVPTETDRLRFLTALCRELDRENGGRMGWARVWLGGRTHEHRLLLRARYHHLLRETAPVKDVSLTGAWRPDPSISTEALLQAVRALESENGDVLSRSRRATVVRGTLLGREVVVKRFAPNPRAWRRILEISRARRAWAGARLLEDLDLNGVRALGWMEEREEGHLIHAWFIAEPLPTLETARVWLRRELPGMSPRARTAFRYALREEILRLHRHGLTHKDQKLSNLLVRCDANGHPSFYRVDLEDIRPRRSSFRTLVRNFYQLNGSLPRQITREEREAFVRGFRPTFPLAAHPWVMRYVERKTRVRLRRELRRVCGA